MLVMVGDTTTIVCFAYAFHFFANVPLTRNNMFKEAVVVPNELMRYSSFDFQPDVFLRLLLHVSFSV